MWKECVIDASYGVRDGMFCFCPIDGDINGEFSVITGMSYIGDAAPEGMKMVAIVHEEGQEAVEKFCEEYAEQLKRIPNDNKKG